MTLKYIDNSQGIVLNLFIKDCWSQLQYLTLVCNLACSEGSKKMVKVAAKLVLIRFSITFVVRYYAKNLKTQPTRRCFLSHAPLRQILQEWHPEGVSGIHTALSNLSERVSMAQFLLNTSHICQTCTAINTFMAVAASCWRNTAAIF